MQSSARDHNGVLTIHNPNLVDSGVYVCTATSYEGTETSSTAKVKIVPKEDLPPSIRTEPQRQTVPQGTAAEVKCIVPSDFEVSWSKLGDQPLGSHILIVGNTLRIANMQIEDRGVYICRASNGRDEVDADAIVEIERELITF